MPLKNPAARKIKKTNDFEARHNAPKNIYQKKGHPLAKKEQKTFPDVEHTYSRSADAAGRIFRYTYTPAYSRFRKTPPQLLICRTFEKKRMRKGKRIYTHIIRAYVCNEGHIIYETTEYIYKCVADRRCAHNIYINQATIYENYNMLRCGVYIMNIVYT